MSTDTPTTEETPDTPTAGETRLGDDRTDGDDAILRLNGLKKHFDTSSGLLDRLTGEGNTVKAVDGVNLDLYEGETLAVVGESGCGKSTLGQTILNLHAPTAGEVRYEGVDLAGLSSREMRPYRRDLQMIFQDPLAALNPRQTVGEIVTAPMEVHGIGDSDEDRLDRARDLLERVGLEAGHVNRYPHQFSGGQQQRVGVARALTLEPQILVADEPVSALDVSVQAQILRLLSRLQGELGLSLLFITHDLSVVGQIADRVAVMYLGEIVEVAPVDRLFEDPQHPYTKSLLSAVPRIDPDRRADRIVLEGSVPSPIDPPSGCRFHTRCPEVIPPEDWAADQEAFRSAFSFRNRVLGGDVDVDGIRTRLELRGEDDAAAVDAVADQIVSEAFRGGAERLPPDATAAVEAIARSLAESDDERARERAREAFPSPCERDRPRDVPVGDGFAACHRVDPDAPG